MPSKSPAQHRLMEAAAHGMETRSNAGPSQDVAKEFVQADQDTGKFGSRDNYRGGEGGAFHRKMGQAKYNKAHYGSNTEPSAKTHPSTDSDEE